MKLLLGTSNPSKLAHFRDLVQDRAEAVSLSQVHCEDVEIEEAGRTAGENAYLKARTYARASGLPVLAGDSGLLLLDLPPNDPEQPGTHVRRVAGDHATDEEMLEYYKTLAHRHGGRLRVVYQNAFCLYAGENRYWMLEESPADCAPRAFLLVDTPHPLRRPGWPLDSISLRIATGRYFIEEKNEQASADMHKMNQTYRRWLHAHLPYLEDGYAVAK